jgi:alpha-L-rhamnosidase
MKIKQTIKIIPHQTESIFTATENPTLSWAIQGSQPGQKQQGYQIIAASSPDLLPTNPDIWNSGYVHSEKSLFVKWQGPKLTSRQRVYWAVKVFDQNNQESEWSVISLLENALLDNKDWKAKWINFTGNNPAHSAPCPFLRHEFKVSTSLHSARLYITARGLFECSINGQKISKDHFVPGWTDFNKQIQYMAYDITNFIHAGDNCIGAILGDGWYSGYLSGRRRNIYGKYPQLLVQLELIYQNGNRQLVVSDEKWQTTTGPILYSDIYDGEMYDARLEFPGWDKAGFDTTGWESAKATALSTDFPKLVLKNSPTVRCTTEIKPIKILNPRKDLYIFDLGQNISGWAKIKFKGRAGILYTITFGEMLNQDQTLYNLNYRSARSTDYYICKGSEDGELWEPHFTFHGFRYIQIDGFQFANIDIEEIEVIGVVLHSDLKVSGKFSCSNEKINQLYSNICWGQRSNFFEIPTDCPQRDERLGWTGDAQIFIQTAAYNMNVLSFFKKWLRDVRETQRPDGAIACIAPNILPNANYGSAAWDDAIIICPWVLYQSYGDIDILIDNYTAMSRWVDYQKNTSNNLIRPETGYGDWLTLSEPTTPKSLIGTAYFAYTCGIMERIAKILDESEDAIRFKQLGEQVKAAFISTFIGNDGKLLVQTQTACILALYFKLLPVKLEEKNQLLLCDLIRQAGNKLNTGFVGTGLLAPALSEFGATKLAYDLLFQEEYPSWLFSVNQGATTIWERWNSFTHETGFGNVNMNSFNHYAYGAIGEWMFSTIAGIQFDSDMPGGKQMILAAQPDSRLRHAAAELITGYGKVKSQWHFSKDTWNWSIEIPQNTSAKVIFPLGKHEDILLNGTPLKSFSYQDNKIVSQFNSGQYNFTINNLGSRDIAM